LEVEQPRGSNVDEGGEGGIHGHYPIEPHIGGSDPGDTRVDYSGREWIRE